MTAVTLIKKPIGQDVTIINGIYLGTLDANLKQKITTSVIPISQQDVLRV